jgi:hypothetical protein
MHYTAVTSALLVLLPAFTLGAPTLAARQDEGPALAQSNWAQDTAVVSQFLSTGASLTGQDLVNAATNALSFENDELVHKGVLDNLLLNADHPDIVKADNILGAQGNFQFVVTGLTNLAFNGLNFTPDQVLSQIQQINNVRCSLVLPSIDTYLQTAAVLSGNAFPNAAVRPNNCP